MKQELRDKLQDLALQALTAVAKSTWHCLKLVVTVLLWLIFMGIAFAILKNLD